ncbi:unnamed protein product [Urochloa decumbens]|uniref:Uncharacterized protein n=1 Tax=Urochloa decumbens TaxID=240449 RepID=A0ABC9AT08_9POAL
MGNWCAKTYVLEIPITSEPVPRGRPPSGKRHCPRASRRRRPPRHPRARWVRCCLCTERATGINYACKSVSKRKLARRADVGDVRREIAILQHLSGQPNVVEFKAAFEDADSVHIVMELCPGGELFDRIKAKGAYSERQASGVCGDIVTIVIVRDCHFMGVMHRNVQPENLLLASAAEDAPLKATDFGISVFIEQGNIYKDIVGAVYYVAPEVLHGNYGKEIDVWSVGVILYILLCGPPFWGETEKATLDAILGDQLDLSSTPWPSISESAKDLIRKMLNRDPQKRITAAQALEHPWLKGAAPDRPVDSALLSRMKQFKAMNKLKQIALKVIAENLSPEETKGLKQMFNNLDTDKSGTIEVEELKEGLRKLGSKISAEVQKLMEAVDVDRSGSIDCTEFLTAMMDKHKLENEEGLLRAFQYFDKDNNGYITRDELEQAMARYRIGEASIIQVLAEVDKDKGQIDWHAYITVGR